MSNYENFVSDFPQRCGDLLTAFVGQAKRCNREVTLMLSVATSGLVIPYERLRSGASHPSRDQDKFKEVANRLTEALDRPFLSSELWDDASGSWIFSKQVDDPCEELDFWPELLQPKSMTEEKGATSVIEHLRNALAHGNIFTQGDPIERIVFLSRVCHGSDKYKMLAVHPNDFLRFLEKWFSVLSRLRIPSGLVEDQQFA